MKRQIPHKWRWMITLTMAISVVVLTGFYAVSQIHNHAQGSQESPATTQVPTVSIQPQPDSPLRISAVKLDTADYPKMQVNVEVLNTESKAISAFAIRQDDGLEYTGSGGVTLTQMSKLSTVLQPAQTKTITTGAETYPKGLENISLAVDFIEFIDGTRWGTDKFKSGERMDGQRAGASVAIARFLKLLETGDSSTIINSVNSDKRDEVPPSSHSSQWEEGFMTGIGVIRNRLRQANKTGGLTEVELELRRPYDALNRRR